MTVQLSSEEIDLLREGLAKLGDLENDPDRERAIDELSAKLEGVVSTGLPDDQ